MSLATSSRSLAVCTLIVAEDYAMRGAFCFLAINARMHSTLADNAYHLCFGSMYDWGRSGRAAWRSLHSKRPWAQ